MREIARLRGFFVVLSFLCFASLPATAATWVVSSDADLVHQSDDAVLATSLASTVERDARGAIVTRYTLRIDEVMKGPRRAGQHLVLTERGGVLGDEARWVSGTPVYEPGAQYLVFTSNDRNLDPTTFGLSLGQFRVLREGGRTFAIRTGIHGFDARNLEPHQERARDARRFMNYVREIAADRQAEADYFVENARAWQESLEWKIESQFTRTSYLMQVGGQGFRWQTPSATFVRNGTAPASTDGAASVSKAFSEWNGAGASINYQDNGTDTGANGGLENTDGKNAVLFGDPNGEIGSGVAGIGGISIASGQFTVDGETFYKTAEVDVVIANMSFSQSCLNSVMTHEVGHTLGLRHSNQPPSNTDHSTTDAIMNSTTSCSFNGSLRTYDETAVQTVYGSGPACTNPSITTQPASKSGSLGETLKLTVVATGTSLTYAWYQGAAGDTSTPVGTNSSSLTVNTSATGSFSYWVRVSGACGTPVDSAAATVTVTCASPGITTQPAGKSITAGQSASLEVTASGSQLTYQWYAGNRGETGSPVAGGTAAKLVVKPSATTSYWVRVSGACGDPVDSNAATVTVAACGNVTISSASASAVVGGRSTLTAVASSTSTPLTYQWYRGTTPGSGGTLVGSSASITVTVTTAASYWVRVTNGCGQSAVSELVNVASCVLPTITVQPQNQTIAQGASATLSLESNGTLVKWYRGDVGNVSAQVATGASFSTGALSETTRYWAQVSNSCGSIASSQVIVTVNPVSETVHLLNGRFAVQVRYRNQHANPVSEGQLLGRSLFSSALSESAVFTFNDPLTVELMVRFSDARPWDDHVHFYAGGLSDVEFFITVTDSATGITKTYHKAAGELAGELDRTSFVASIGSGATVAPAAASVVSQADDSTIHLLNGRFRVRMHYRNQHANPATEGYLLGRSIASSSLNETAIFYFTNPESAEWLVRISDTRPFADRIDLYHGGLSDVEYTIEVTDTVTGVTKVYEKAPGSLMGEVDRTTYRP